jgi:hypothetical protein
MTRNQQENRSRNFWSELCVIVVEGALAESKVPSFMQSHLEVFNPVLPVQYSLHCHFGRLYFLQVHNTVLSIRVCVFCGILFHFYTQELCV